MCSRPNRVIERGGFYICWQDIEATYTNSKDAYTLVTLPRIVTPYRDSVDGTRGRVTYQKLVTR